MLAPRALLKPALLTSAEAAPVFSGRRRHACPARRERLVPLQGPPQLPRRRRDSRSSRPADDPRTLTTTADPPTTIKRTAITGTPVRCEVARCAPAAVKHSLARCRGYNQFGWRSFWSVREKSRPHVCFRPPRKLLRQSSDRKGGSSAALAVDHSGRCLLAVGLWLGLTSGGDRGATRGRPGWLQANGGGGGTPAAIAAAPSAGTNPSDAGSTSSSPSKGVAPGASDTAAGEATANGAGTTTPTNRETSAPPAPALTTTDDAEANPPGSSPRARWRRGGGYLGCCSVAARATARRLSHRYRRDATGPAATNAGMTTISTGAGGPRCNDRR